VNVAVVTHFYPPEPGAGATRVASLVDALAKAGHDVTVVTNFPSFPRGRFFDRSRPPVRVEHGSRSRVVRLFSLLVPGMPAARFVHWTTSAISLSLYLLLTRRRFDVVAISSPPITLALCGLLGAARHRAKLVVDVRDVFPDLAIQMGTWKPGTPLARAIEWLVRRLYRRANLIVAVTPTAISQIAARGVDGSRLLLARNAAGDTSEVRAAHRPANGFTAIYAGNLGLATDVDVLVDAATLLSGEHITIEIVGDGAQRARLDERVRSEGLRNVRVLGSYPRDEAMGMIASADVCVIPLRSGILESIPTKIYDSLSVGCPVVVAAGGEAQREGTALGALCTPPGDASALADALRRLARLDRATLRNMGAQGKACIRQRADRADIMAEVARHVSELAVASSGD
jgi:glycosyltransferase involved in cell wall biosynthesis